MLGEIAMVKGRPPEVPLGESSRSDSVGKFRITKRIDAENVFNKLVALNQAYQCFLQVPGYHLDGDDHTIVGMNLLFEETLIELELLLFDERYTESSYIEKAEKLED